MLLTRVYDALLTVAYPQSCLVCGGSVEERRFGVACQACWEATQVFDAVETICWKCGALSPGIEVTPDVRREVRCRRCDAQSFAAARAVGLYEGALRESVLRLKRQPHLSSHLIDLLAAAAQREPLNTATRIMPVPLHDQRTRERGFNQATAIAEALAKRLKIPVDAASLERVRGSEKYRAGLDPKARRDSVAGAFAVRHPRLVDTENILLVDDVFTTGATVNACAEALLASGTGNVFVLTIARGKS
ncbi:MAG: ComF family protein [Acidobacteria bacterium]|nr:ComF family protein [Acidobacteriota bacterium]